MITKGELIQFENEVKALWEAGEIPYLTHFSGGNEDQLIKIFTGVRSGDWVFSTHRSHYHYLLAGGDRNRLMQVVREGKSMFVFDKEINFYTSSILAGSASIAAGVAMSLAMRASSNHVWCFIGDGASDEGHFHEAARLVDARKLPCTFILEDNDRSVTISKEQRWGGLASIPKYDCVWRYSYVPTWPHAGSGCKHKIVFKDIEK